MTCREHRVYAAPERHALNTVRGQLEICLDEVRKTKVGLMLASQYLQAIEPDIRHAVLGNAGTLMSFRVGPDDASVLAKEFQPTFGGVDLLNLPNYAICLKIMIRGTPSTAFSASTLKGYLGACAVLVQ